MNKNKPWRSKRSGPELPETFHDRLLRTLKNKRAIAVALIFLAATTAIAGFTDSLAKLTKQVHELLARPDLAVGMAFYIEETAIDDINGHMYYEVRNLVSNCRLAKLVLENQQPVTLHGGPHAEIVLRIVLSNRGETPLNNLRLGLPTMPFKLQKIGITPNIEAILKQQDSQNETYAPYVIEVSQLLPKNRAVISLRGKITEVEHRELGGKSMVVPLLFANATQFQQQGNAQVIRMDARSVLEDEGELFTGRRGFSAQQEFTVGAPNEKNNSAGYVPLSAAVECNKIDAGIW